MIYHLESILSWNNPTFIFLEIISLFGYFVFVSANDSSNSFWLCPMSFFRFIWMNQFKQKKKKKKIICKWFAWFRPELKLSLASYFSNIKTMNYSSRSSCYLSSLSRVKFARTAERKKHGETGRSTRKVRINRDE